MRLWRSALQQQVLHIARQHTGLHRSADRHNLIRVHTPMRLLAEQLLHQLLDLRHTCLTANQHNLIDLARVNAGILHRLLARPNRLLQQIIHQRLQLRAGQLAHKMFRPASIGSNEGQIDLRLLRRRQLNLRALRSILQPLQRHLISLRMQVKPGL